MKLSRKNETLTIYKDGFHYENKRKKGGMVFKKRGRKQIYDICFIKKNHKQKNITEKDLVSVIIDKETNSSYLHISLTYSAMKNIHEIVEYIENVKESKRKIKELDLKDWKTF